MVERRRRDGGEEGGGMKHKVSPVYGGGGMGARILLHGGARSVTHGGV